jgi:hypothetical protein
VSVLAAVGAGVDNAPWVVIALGLLAAFIGGTMGAWSGWVYWQERPEVGFAGFHLVMMSWMLGWTLWGGLIGLPVQIWGLPGALGSAVVLWLGWKLRRFLCPRWPSHLWKPPPSPAK